MKITVLGAGAGGTAMAPTDAVPKVSSETLLQRSPPSVVFQTPLPTPPW